MKICISGALIKCINLFEFFSPSVILINGNKKMSMLWDLFGSQIISDDSGELWGHETFCAPDGKKKSEVPHVETVAWNIQRHYLRRHL